MTTTETCPTAETKKPTLESIPFRVHPRVFSALGADLVTNDVVAVIELVKNSYDAFARHVQVNFQEHEDGTPCLAIVDDGLGMTRDVIENSWCTVATPHKTLNQSVKQGGIVRRVVGSKGLGRLSAARLGNRLIMLTQAPQSPCWEVTVNWPQLAEGNDISLSTVTCREFDEPSPFTESGTSIRILDLKETWDQDRIQELADNLGRLLSPFEEREQFIISLTESNLTTPIEIAAPQFLSEPKYSIKGTVDDQGNVVGTYEFAPIGAGTDPRTQPMGTTWSQIYGDNEKEWKFPHSAQSAKCGPFTFEIRAWDISSEDTAEIASKYSIQRSIIRDAIRLHKGISVYRDGVLTLPKSEGARDWLGLDLRRVSQVGRRLSTNQIVGYVSISADNNPKIEDTSDRERLSMCAEVEEFEEIIRTVVGLLASGRNDDRAEPGREQPLTELFANLSAEKLVAETTALAQAGANASAIVKLVRDFDESLNQGRQEIETRFVYYSRLATVGSIAQMLVHEIRNRTTVIGSALSFFNGKFGQLRDQDTDKHIRRAEDAVSALETLADKFSPLASRNFRRRQRNSVLEDCIRDTLDIHKNELRSKGIHYSVPESKTTVAVDPGELSAIIINLTSNALYWLEKTPRDARRLEFQTEPSADGKRVTVYVHDTGPGLEDGDEEKILWPGVTRKPNGVGMGLTLASEIVAAHGGDLAVIHPGMKDGASFKFDFPCPTQVQEKR